MASSETTIFPPQTISPELAGMGQELAFRRKLQAVANKIYAATNIEQSIHEICQDLCLLFKAEGVVIFLVNDDRSTLVSYLKRSIGGFGKPPPVSHVAIGPQSIAGFVATSKLPVNIADVYDAEALCRIHPDIRFLQNADNQTGYRTRQVLAFPLLAPDSGEVIGVVQLTNSLSGLPFPPLMESVAIEIAKPLAIAFRQRQRGINQVKTMFDLLVAENIISAMELDLAQRAARKKRAKLEDILIDEFQVDPAAIGRSLAAYFGVPYEAYRANRIKPMHLLKNIKQDYVLTNGWVPIDETEEDGIVILTCDPESVRSSRVVNNVFPRKNSFSYRVCLNRDFIKTVQQFYDTGLGTDNVGDLLTAMEEGNEEDAHGPSIEELAAAEDNELVKLVNKIIINAYNMGASDIHFEPYPGQNKLQVRLRRDGALMPYIEIPSRYRHAIVARVKIMADLDISERRIPQDGKIKFRKFGGLNIELRVTTVPTAGGLEDVIMRILPSGEPIPLDQLALAPNTLNKLKELAQKPYGLLLACGPTGSGKTTTLHSIMSFINTPENKIWTAEDPVEITQRGLRQVQVNRKAGLTFATVMRAFLRADPDVIMVGEMRDRETVALGIEASLTGHLVLSTLHTNNAPESIVRLLDMGMDSFNFADALLGILAQRLAKRLCACKKPYVADEQEIAGLLNEYCHELEATPSWQADPQAARQAVLDEWRRKYADKTGRFTLYKATGCDKCNQGYRGRIGLFELLEGTDAIKRAIQEHAHVAQIYAIALEEGMRTLKQDGISKVLAGITDMQQVRKVCIK